MQRRTLSSPVVVASVLILQFVPLVLFPASSFSPRTQEWWLPVLLAVMVAVADFQIMLQRTPQLGPWHLLAFAQGFNVISRLMMVWSHATISSGGSAVANVPYLVLTTISILLSLFVLWYSELPEVRMAFLPR